MTEACRFERTRLKVHDVDMLFQLAIDTQMLDGAGSAKYQLLRKAYWKNT